MVRFMELGAVFWAIGFWAGLSFFRYARYFNPYSVLGNTEFRFIHFGTPTKVYPGIALYCQHFKEHLCSNDSYIQLFSIRHKVKSCNFLSTCHLKLNMSGKIKVTNIVHRL